MVEQKNTLIRGGIYLAKLDPAKAAEIGKIRPVILLNAQSILDVIPPTVFICPLGSKSQPTFSHLHTYLSAKDNLFVDSYALIEHCRSISLKRLLHPRLSQLTSKELSLILHRLKIMIDV